jgi:hypothetical protein
MCSGTLAVAVWLPGIVGLVGDDHSHRTKPFGVQLSGSDGVMDALSGRPFFGNDLGNRFTQVISGHNPSPPVVGVRRSFRPRGRVVSGRASPPQMAV